jgi:hypothetical protein
VSARNDHGSDHAEHRKSIDRLGPGGPPGGSLSAGEVRQHPEEKRERRPDPEPHPLPTATWSHPVCSVVRPAEQPCRDRDQERLPRRQGNGKRPGRQSAEPGRQQRRGSEDAGEASTEQRQTMGGEVWSSRVCMSSGRHLLIARGGAWLHAPPRLTSVAPGRRPSNRARVARDPRQVWLL